MVLKENPGLFLDFMGTKLEPWLGERDTVKQPAQSERSFPGHEAWLPVPTTTSTLLGRESYS